jgi:hypothetical protein
VGVGGGGGGGSFRGVTRPKCDVENPLHVASKLN